MDEDATNDPDERFTEELLRQTLGSKFTPEILEQVLKSERLLVARKDHLVDLVDAGVIADEEFADLVNRLLPVYLKAVADIVGEDACRRMYDFGPEDQIILVDPRGLPPPPPFDITPETLAAIVNDERIIARASVTVKRGDDDFEDNLAEVIEFLTAKSGLMLAGGASSGEVSCWQATVLAVYLANTMEGEGARRLVWRVAEKTMLLTGCRLQATANAVDEFYRLCLGVQVEPDTDIVSLGAEETGAVENWLSGQLRGIGSAFLQNRDT